MNRRNVLMMAGASLTLGARGQTAPPKPSGGPELPLEKYEPKSMLHLPETKVPRSRYPVIDANLETAIARLQTSHPDRFVVLMEPAWDRVADPGYASYQAEESSGRTKRKRAGSKF